MPVKTIGTFHVTSLEVLGPDGTVDAALDPGLNPEELLRLYRAMMLSRRADERMLKLQRQGRVGTCGPCIGQEAAICGPAAALGTRDWLVPSFRELGALLMRGVPLSQAYLYWRGYEEANVAPGVERTLPGAVPVGSQAVYATGIAYALKYRKEQDAAVLVYFGDGATSQGDFHEALNFAALWQAPVVFLCQNNQWAISLPRARQTASATIAQKAVAYGMPGLQVDGNDVLATYRAAKEALERARAGGGPTLIEAVTYRLMMHTTSDDPAKYRDEAEVQPWWAREPLLRFETYLTARGLLDGERKERLERELKDEVDGAVRSFEAARDFKPDAPFDHVYGTTHPAIEAQRREFLSELAANARDARGAGQAEVLHG